MPIASPYERAGEAPLVSVVTPFLNPGAFLAEAIDSVEQQSFASWELLLVDDGSTDGSSALARECAERAPDRIRYFAHEGQANLGKSVSRNLGVRKARGRYVTFLDADDVLLPHKLAHQTALLGRYPEVGMVYGSTEYWRSWDPARRGRRKRDTRGKLGVRAERLYSPPTLLTAWLRDPGAVPCLCAALARTDRVRSVGAFDERIQDLYEDQIFLVRMVMSAPVYVESGCGERYRQHHGSTSAHAVAAGDYHPLLPNPARFAFLEWLQQYLESRQALEGALAHALAAALRPYRYPSFYRALLPFTLLVGRLRGLSQ